MSNLATQNELLSELSREGTLRRLGRGGLNKHPHHYSERYYPIERADDAPHPFCLLTEGYWEGLDYDQAVGPYRCNRFTGRYSDPRNYGEGDVVFLNDPKLPRNGLTMLGNELSLTTLPCVFVDEKLYGLKITDSLHTTLLQLASESIALHVQVVRPFIGDYANIPAIQGKL